MEDQVTTCDLYEAAYYMLQGCELSAIEGVKLNGKISCKIKLSGDAISKHQIDFFQANATVNLMDFRRTFGTLFNIVQKQKKRFKNIADNGGAL
jgi:hypothetical protein